MSAELEPRRTPQHAPGESLVVDARRHQPKPSGCVNCGEPIDDDAPTPKKHCSKSHKKEANKRRRAGVAVVYEPGICPCGARFDAPAEPSSRRFCSRRCRQSWYSARPFRVFKSLVRRPRDLAWLAGKLGGTIAGDDPRLAQIALKLAEAGKLVVYVNRAGEVAEVGRPKHEATS